MSNIDETSRVYEVEKDEVEQVYPERRRLSLKEARKVRSEIDYVAVSDMSDGKEKPIHITYWIYPKKDDLKNAPDTFKGQFNVDAGDWAVDQFIKREPTAVLAQKVEQKVKRRGLKIQIS